MIPLTVLGGYLGAGKTTLLNALIARADGRRYAVLVNDFGALPVDAALIEARDGDVLSLTGGCVCCAYGDDLSAALAQVRDMEPDAVLLEASGVALPGPIAASAALIPGLAVEGVVVLADAETLAERLADRWTGDTVARQLAAADLVLLTKADLVGDISAASGLVGAHTDAPVIACANGAVDPDVVVGPLRRTRAPDDATPVRPHLDGLHREVLHTDDDPAAVARRLADDPAVLRAKGRVGDGLVQVVGRRHAVTPAPDGMAAGVVVVRIGGR